MRRLLRWFRYSNPTTAPDEGAVVVDPVIEELFGDYWGQSLDQLKTPNDWRRDAERAYSSGYRAACRDIGVEVDVEYIYPSTGGVLPRYTAKVPA